MYAFTFECMYCAHKWERSKWTRAAEFQEEFCDKCGHKETNVREKSSTDVYGYNYPLNQTKLPGGKK